MLHLKELLGDPRIDVVNAIDASFGQTALHLACSHPSFYLLTGRKLMMDSRNPHGG